MVHFASRDWFVLCGTFSLFPQRRFKDGAHNALGRHSILFELRLDIREGERLYDLFLGKELNVPQFHNSVPDSRRDVVIGLNLGFGRQSAVPRHNLGVGIRLGQKCFGRCNSAVDSAAAAHVNAG